jgi:hypothetical protein
VFLNKCYFYCALSRQAEFPNYPKFCLSEIGSVPVISHNRGSTVHNNNNHGSTALYGLGPPLSEVTWSAHLWQFGDQPTGRAVQLNPDVTARAIWQAVRRHGWEMASKFSLRNICIHARKFLLHSVNLRHGTDGFTSPPKEVVLRIFITLKNTSSVGIEPTNLGSSGEHSNH